MDKSSQIAAVIGHPIAHSLSPQIHTYWLKELRMDGEYRAHDVKPEALADAIKKYADQGYMGLNITLPHKESAAALCDDLSAAARAVGAVNTIVFANNKTLGDNTDAEGFFWNFLDVVGEDFPPPLNPLPQGEGKLIGHANNSLPPRGGGLGWGGNSAIILGAGGAARAVAFALKNLGVEEFLIYNRDVDRAKKLIADLSLHGTAISLTSRFSPLDSDILVNCTSLGMAGQPPLNIDLSALGKGAVVADIVYRPLQTELLKNAQKRGLKTVDGLGMLIHQAAAAFEQFYGVEAGEIKSLRKILEQQFT